MKYAKITVALIFAAVLGMFVSAPSRYMQSFFDGLTVWAYNVLPALFPFSVMTALALKCVPTTKRSVTKKLFGVPCDDIWTTSLLCGYPMGAKAIADSNADADTATRLCAFCSTAGPIFMIATVGARLLHNSTAAAIILTAQVAASVLNGLIFSKKSDIPLQRENSKPSDFGGTLTDSALSVISVGGLIALFYMLSDMVKSVLPAALSENLAVAYVFGLLEMTNGIFAVCKIADVATATVLCSSLLALGGVCVFAQCYAFLGRKRIKISRLIAMKATQCALATAITFALVKLFL